MAICKECNIEMIENCIIKGQHPFEVGIDGTTNISIHIPTKEKSSFLGIEHQLTKNYPIKAKICPKCGKIELYAEL